MPSGETRSRFISHCAEQGVQAVFHYQPLHSSPFAVHNLPAQLDCPVSQELGDCLVRLPLFPGMTREQVDLVVDAVTSFRL
jgi:dTDP-4-amino-4,6-dideoxygalactose transaminase